ncbi:MAG TPA: N-acetylmuramoyl-L-alanine amidase, partial [Acidobacteriaceae bacterium]|nr:N-acetylmuramoyl-L-alanine amidase [Acidobacteriaceae bacterium]
QQTPIAILQGVRSWTQGSLTRVAVDLSGPAAYRMYPAPERHQLVLIVFGARPAGSLLNHAISFQRDFQVRSANVKALTHDQTEVVLQLVRPLKFSSFTLTKPDRLILDFQVAGEHAPAPTAPPGKLLSQSIPQSSLSAAKEPSAVWNSENGPVQTGQHSMTRVLGLRVRRIVIDPGHGGHDSGTLGPGGLKEKDVALEVALRLGRLLQQQMNAEVIYTRSTDKFVPLEQRTALANQAHADLFLSIHANSSPDPDARGVETYFLNFTASPAALNVAARENAVSNRSVYELSDLVRRITLSDKIDESRAFAEDVQQSLYTGLAAGNEGLKNRGVKQAPFVVLIGAHMPSILAEISFLTNPLDAEELSQPEYRQRLAEALYRGVSEYVDGMSGVRVAKTSPGRIIPAQPE